MFDVDNIGHTACGIVADWSETSCRYLHQADFACRRPRAIISYAKRGCCQERLHPLINYLDPHQPIIKNSAFTAISVSGWTLFRRNRLDILVGYMLIPYL